MLVTSVQALSVYRAAAEWIRVRGFAICLLNPRPDQSGDKCFMGGPSLRWLDPMKTTLQSPWAGPTLDTPVLGASTALPTQVPSLFSFWEETEPQDVQ